MDSNKKWRIENYEHYREMTRRLDKKYYYRINAEMYSLLGGKCKHCNIDDPRVFQIDHVDGGGNSRKIKNRSGQGLRRQMLQEIREGSERYQLLCANCNIIKKHENGEIKGHITKSKEQFILENL